MLKANPVTLIIVAIVGLICLISVSYYFTLDNADNNGDQNLDVDDNQQNGENDNNTESFTRFADASYTGWEANHSLDESDVFWFMTNWTEWNQSFIKKSGYNESIHFVPDFSNCSYVYLYWEVKGTAGYDIDVSNIILHDNGTLTIVYNKSISSGGTIYQIITYPDDFVKVSKEYYAHDQIVAVQFIDYQYYTHTL